MPETLTTDQKCHNCQGPAQPAEDLNRQMKSDAKWGRCTACNLIWMCGLPCVEPGGVVRGRLETPPRERRALVQKSWEPDTRREYPSGTISWADHEKVWQAYREKWRVNQSAERIQERGGFGHTEIIELLGAMPESFVPSPLAVTPYRQL